MGSPPLPVGTCGRIQVYPLNWGGIRARVRYQDYDGVTRHIERSAPRGRSRVRCEQRDPGATGAGERDTPRSCYRASSAWRSATTHSTPAPCAS